MSRARQSAWCVESVIEQRDKAEQEIKELQAHVERLRNTLRHLLPFGRSEGDSFFEYHDGSEEIGQHVADSYYATPRQSLGELKAQAVEQAAELTKLVASVGADPNICRYSDLLNEANNFRECGELQYTDSQL